MPEFDEPAPLWMRLMIPVGLATLLVIASCGLLGAESVETAKDDATCSPKADLWHQTELARVCGEKETDECPAAAELRARYMELEAEECSRKP